MPEHLGAQHATLATNRSPGKSRQRGQIVLVLLAMLGLAVAGAFFYCYSPASQAIEGDKVTHAAMAQARDALIGRAEARALRKKALHLTTRSMAL